MQSANKSEVEKILNDHQLGTLATVKDGKPFSRYMTFFNDDLTLYTATDNHTHKVDDIKNNPNVHILIGYTYDGLNDKYLEIEGQADVENTEGIKSKLWNEKLEPWFDGPEDPNYSVLKITPTEIRLMNTEDHEPRILEL
ncbi:pyridoxamine 5'-phosphate oxidase family protein [Aquibacillus koreensis]|uniref:Pyridoxamine 5'-phosphate oxidase family protein n=1 Tax=Aquibacillus koreensis TaxID=279446 RepID=A0A9X3WP10_9BACI|nr:pyridoxamine 5'-phosphate oxidase family protein [Aquibacillus koreensis]MCT2536179.1 pyridoxamine 5'-phosphate oxidase family protein [Aquibacillus koreensis]MDC3422103.1 pyridoxamine 5'-phosphate oxidase family protein [Aquibacillus koreensis]